MTTRLAEVTEARGLLESAVRRATPGQRPTIHAKFAIVNADLIDRRSGITFEAERTPGLAISQAVLRAAH